ncbi:uncharacterized protein LOC129259611 [Lytechinus pictus]|uniref:uncharacterized protein LOC129259611 n=1 Tax=Lytechinus pictus TaxID=7653 RepID=UPI0030B9C9AB
MSEPGGFGRSKVLHVSKSIFRKPRRFPGLPPLPSNRAPDGSSNGLGAGGGGRGTGGLEPVSGAPFRTLQPSFSDSSVSFSSDAYNDSSYNSYPNSTALIPAGSGSSDTSGLGDFVGSFMIFIEFLKEKKHIFIQYFVIGCLIGIILSLISWVFHLKRKKAKLKKKLRGSDGTDGRQRANGVLAAVQEENRIDIDEIWRSPPPPSILNRVSPTEDDNDNTIWRSHTLPGSRQLNSYYP